MLTVRRDTGGDCRVSAGVELDARGYIKVNDRLETSAASP
jgi:hypothetical protein